MMGPRCLPVNALLHRLYHFFFIYLDTRTQQTDVWQTLLPDRFYLKILLLLTNIIFYQVDNGYLNRFYVGTQIYAGHIVLSIVSYTYRQEVNPTHD